MIVDEPQSLVSLATARRRAGAGGAPGDRAPRRRLRRPGAAVRGAASSCARSAAAGACTCARSTTTWSREFVLTQAPTRLSQAALETLAVIAYKQPVTRGSGRVDPCGQRRLGRAHAARRAASSPRRSRTAETGAIHYGTTDAAAQPTSASTRSTSCRTSRRCSTTARTDSTSSDRCDERRHRAARRDAPSQSTDGRAPAEGARGRGRRIAPGLPSSYIVEGRVRGQRRDRDRARQSASTRRPTWSTSTASPCSSTPPSATSCSTSPRGVVSSMRRRARPPRPAPVHRGLARSALYNVGRLDAETSGLLVLTNDGELAHVLAHPSFGVTKVYIAKVEGRVTAQTIPRLTHGRRARRRTDRRRQGAAARRARPGGSESSSS